MKNTKQVTETAILLAIYMIFFAFAFFVPILGIVFVWALPLPFVLNTVRNGRNAAIAMIAAALVLSIFFSAAAVPLTWTFAGAGFVIGEMFRRKKTPFQILLAGALAYIANFVLLYILMVVFTGINPVADSVNSVKEMIGELSASSDFPEGTEAQIEMLLEQLDFIAYLTPSMLILGALVFALVSQLISGMILKRLKHEVQPWKPFHQWSFPKNLIFYYLIVLVLAIIGLEEGSTLFVLVANLEILLGYAMVLQGFTVIFAFSKMKGWSQAVPILITIGSFLLVFPLQIVKLLGIIDLGLNLRSRMKF